MATPDLETANLLNELQQAERDARMHAWWRAHGSKVAAGAIAIVLASAATVYWQSRQLAQSQAATRALNTAVQELQSASYAKATTEVAPVLAEKSHSILAMIVKAQALEEQKQQGAALDAWRDIAKSTTADAALRDAARLSVARLSADDAEVHQMLDAASTPGAPYAAIALQTKIALLIAANKPEDATIALAALQAIKNQPPASAKRTAMLASALVRNPNAAPNAAPAAKE